MQVSVHSNSLYYNILYVNAQMHSKKRGETLFWRKVYFEGYKIYYILY
nr:MAG TPA: hypothetical protein [Caudoviricetes sp.]